jgi:hypothetical protein
MADAVNANDLPRVGWPIDYSGTREAVLAKLETWQPPVDDNDDVDDWRAARALLIERCESTKAAFVGVFAEWKANPWGRRGPNGWHLTLSFAELEESPQ